MCVHVCVHVCVRVCACFARVYKYTVHVCIYVQTYLSVSVRQTLSLLEANYPERIKQVFIIKGEYHFLGCGLCCFFFTCLPVVLLCLLVYSSQSIPSCVQPYETFP